MLTTSELLEIQDSLQGKNSIQLIPILESPKTSKLDGPGIEINPIFISKGQESKKAKACKGLCFKHPDDNNIWFKIRNATKISHLIKIFDNKTVWKQQCTFPCHTISACYCKNVIVVSLIDNTLNFIDSCTGCPCLPSILLSGYTKYLQRIDEDKIVIITNKNQLIIYQIDANTIPKCLLKVYFYGSLEDIRYVELTQELKTKQLSPIIQTESNRYRYSIARQCWTLPDYEYKSPFVKPEDNFESLDNVINNFGYSLLTHNQTLMEKTYLIMLNETPYECAIRLIEYHNAGIREISGILLSDVLEHAFGLIQSSYPEIVERITESEQYKLYLTNIKRKEETQQDKENNNANMNAYSTDTIANTNPNGGNNFSNISITNNSNMNPNNADTNNLSNTNQYNASSTNTPNSTPNNNLLNNTKTNKSPTKQQIITRELPVIESEKVDKRNPFDGKIYSPIQDTHEFFYNFDTSYENYIELSQKKDPKIDKYIEAFSYSSNEQKEMAKKLKLKLPSSKKRSKSTENDNKDDVQNKQKKKKKRFIKPEIQKKSSQSRTIQQQPLLLTPSYIHHPAQPMQQIPQNRNILNVQIQSPQQQIQTQQIQQIQTQQMQQAQPMHQTQQIPKNINLLWLLNELKNPKQRDIFSNALIKSQWDQVMNLVHLNQKTIQNQQNQQQQQQSLIQQQIIHQKQAQQQPQIPQQQHIQQQSQILQQQQQQHIQQQSQIPQQQQHIQQQPQILQQQHIQQQSQIPQQQQHIQQQSQILQQQQQHIQQQSQMPQQQQQQHIQQQSQMPQQQQQQQHIQQQSQILQQQQQQQQQSQILQQQHIQQQQQSQIPQQSHIQHPSHIQNPSQIHQNINQPCQPFPQILMDPLQQFVKEMRRVQSPRKQNLQVQQPQQSHIQQQQIQQHQPQPQIHQNQIQSQQIQQPQIQQHQIQSQPQPQIQSQQIQLHQQHQPLSQPQIHPQQSQDQQSISEESASKSSKDEPESSQTTKRVKRKRSAKNKDAKNESDTNSIQQTLTSMLGMKPSQLIIQPQNSEQQQQPSPKNLQQNQNQNPTQTANDTLQINLNLQLIDANHQTQKHQTPSKK